MGVYFLLKSYCIFPIVNGIIKIVEKHYKRYSINVLSPFSNESNGKFTSKNIAFPIVNGIINI